MGAQEALSEASILPVFIIFETVDKAGSCWYVQPLAHAHFQVGHGKAGGSHTDHQVGSCMLLDTLELNVLYIHRYIDRKIDRYIER